MIYYLLCILLALSQLSFASSRETNNSDMREFVAYFQSKVGGESVLTNKRAVRMSNAMEKILSESNISMEIRKLILQDAKEYVKKLNILDKDKVYIEDHILIMQDMLFFSANFPKNTSQQLSILSQISKVYDDAEHAFERILKSYDYKQLLAYMRKKFKIAQESSQYAAQSRFYPVHSQVIPPKDVDRILDEFIADIKNKLKKERKQQIATLAAKNLYLIDVPISNFSKALLIASEPPPIHSIEKNHSNKPNKSTEHDNMVTIHPNAVAFYLIMEGCQE